jgi:hypothetical protein
MKIRGLDLILGILIAEFSGAIEKNGARSGAVVEALRYKPEGLGIESRWCHWKFSLT